MRTPEGDAIFAVVKTRVGRDHAITSADICRELRWRPSRERQVRQIISDESMLWPEIVCAAPGKNGGFFRAETLDELCIYDNWLTEIAEREMNKRDAFRAYVRQQGIRLPERAHA